MKDTLDLNKCQCFRTYKMRWHLYNKYNYEFENYLEIIFKIEK